MQPVAAIVNFCLLSCLTTGCKLTETNNRILENLDSSEYLYFKTTYLSALHIHLYEHQTRFEIVWNEINFASTQTTISKGADIDNFKLLHLEL